MSKPTPGPWKAEGPYHAGYDVIAGDYCVASYCTEADARLMAAAPDLLAALELIASFGGKTLIGDGRYDEGAAHAFDQAADVARAALAKATGDA